MEGVGWISASVISAVACVTASTGGSLVRVVLFGKSSVVLETCYNYVLGV